jgi:hypothetical protein
MNLADTLVDTLVDTRADTARVGSRPPSTEVLFL